MLGFMTIVIIVGLFFVLVGVFFSELTDGNRCFIFTVIVAIIAFGVCFVINCSLIESSKAEYPLNSSVQVTVDREKMNDKFGKLSDTEKSILELSKEANGFAITREEGNILIITSKDLKKELVLLNEENDVKWVDYLLKGYFNPVDSK